MVGFIGTVVSRFSRCSRPTCSRFSVNYTNGYRVRNFSVASSTLSFPSRYLQRNPFEFDRASPRLPVFVCTPIRWLSSNITETSSLQQDHQTQWNPHTLQMEAHNGREITNAKLQRLNGYLAYCETRWDESFQKLRAFVERTKRIKVLSTTVYPFPDDRQLRMWLLRQKLEYNKRLVGKSSKLNDQRLQKLLSLGFTIQIQRERSWDEVYKQLCDYVNRNDGIFPYDAENLDSLDAEGQRLHDWCQRQRVQYNRYQMEGERQRAKDNRYHPMDCESRLKIHMTEERIAKLNNICFSWSIHESGWDEKYEELLSYKQHHGDCLVPANYVANPTLAKWVETQRCQYARSKESKQHCMPDRRVALLSQLDFAWDANEARWQLKYNELIEYQNYNGHGILPRYNDPDVAPLHRWLRYQRKAYHKWVNGEKSSLSPQRKEMLDRLGIVWTDVL